MSWNYRVLKRGDDYGVYEVYYDQEGNPHSMSEDPITPTAESLQDLSDTLQLFLEALQKDALNYETLKPQNG